MAFGALSAGAASAAEAPRWSVNASYLGAGEIETFVAPSTSEVVLNQGAPNSAITLAAPAGECTESGEIVGSALGSPGKKRDLTLICKKVKVFYNGIEMPKCPVKSSGAEVGTVKMNPLKSTLVWLNPTGGAVGELLEAQTSPTTPWATVEIFGEACAIASKLNITGAAVNEVTPSEGEALTGTLNFPTTAISNYYSNEGRVKQTFSQLKLGAAASTLSGSFSQSLTSKKPFGLSPGALRWKVVEGAVPRYLFSSDSRTITATNTTTLTIGIPGGKIVLPECSETGKIVGSPAKTSGSKEEVKLTCNGATVEGTIGKAPSCAAKTPGAAFGTIATNALHGTASGGFLAPYGSELVMTIEVTGEACALAGKWNYTGSLKDVVEPVNTEVKSLTTNLAGSALKFGASPAAVTGTMSTSTVSGELFGAFSY